MSKKSVVLLLFAVVVVLIVGAWVVWKTFIAPPTFYAVQLSTGEMYFGQLTHFPYGLKDVYLLTQTGNKDQPISVQKFTNSLIGPEDYLQLNKSDVVWMTRLDNKGQLAQVLLRGGATAEPQVPSGTSAQTPTAPSTSGASPSSK